MPYVNVTTENAGPIDLYYEDHGSGPAVVLLHGWPLSSRAWEPQLVPLVEAGHRVITYDRRGFGRSGQPWDGYEYDTLAADLEVLLDTLGVTDATLVGFSMGGGEVARYWSSYGGKGRVAKLVFASAVTPYLHRTDGNPDGGLDDATIGQFQDAVTGDRIAFLDTFVTSFYTPEGGEELVSRQQHEYARDIAAAASAKGTLDLITAFGTTDLRGDLAAITVPTLVIHGSGDQVVPYEASGRRTHEAVAGSTLALIDGAPHGCNVTHAAAFNRALLDFLAA